MEGNEPLLMGRLVGVGQSGILYNPQSVLWWGLEEWGNLGFVPPQPHTLASLGPHPNRQGLQTGLWVLLWGWVTLTYWSGDRITSQGILGAEDIL